MNKITKRILPFIAGIIIIFSLIMIIGMDAIAKDNSIAINSTNFPDAAFRNYIRQNYDLDDDGKLNSREIENITSIYFVMKSFKNLTGIGYFTNLESVSINYSDCGATLDLSKNHNLVSVFIRDTDIHNIKLNSAYLESFKFYGDMYGQSTESMYLNGPLDLSKCPKLVLAVKEGETWSDDTGDNYVYETRNNTYKVIVPQKFNGFIIDPLKPMSFSVKSVKSGVKLTWKDNKNASKYRVYKKNAQGKWTKIDIVTGLQYIDSSVKAGETSSYSIVAVSSNGTELNTIGNGKSIQYIAPALKTTVKYKDNGIRLSWGTINGADKYRIFRKIGNGDWQKLTTTTSSSFLDKNVTFGKTYSYAVRAMTSNGNFVSDMGEGTSITYQAPALDITLSKLSKGIKISWKTMSGAAKYRIFVKNNGEWTKLATVKAGTSYTDTTAKIGTNTYTVVALSSGGLSMTVQGDGKSIYYYVYGDETLEAEIVDENGNAIIRKVTEDEISEDVLEIITDNPEEEIKDDSEKESEDEIEEISDNPEESEIEEQSVEEVSEGDTNETPEEIAGEKTDIIDEDEVNNSEDTSLEDPSEDENEEDEIIRNETDDNDVLENTDFSENTEDNETSDNTAEAS